MIGVFDSGLGGTLLLENLAKNYPDQEFLFYANRKNAPFGKKSDEELKVIFNECITYFKSHGCSDLIVACNTLCSTIDFSEYSDIKIHDIISSTVQELNVALDSHILLVATTKTISKGRYLEILNQRGYHNISCVALGELAEMVENYASEDEVKAYISSVIPDAKYDAIILGCTHFPAYHNVFKELYGAPIFDSNNLKYQFISKPSNRGAIYIDLEKDAMLEKFLSQHLKEEYHYYEDRPMF